MGGRRAISMQHAVDTQAHPASRVSAGSMCRSDALRRVASRSVSVKQTHGGGVVRIGEALARLRPSVFALCRAFRLLRDGGASGAPHAAG